MLFRRIFPIDLTSSNFIKLENTIIDQEIDERWTDQEILLLLEGIELYDDEWMKIAEYVGTKTHRQCISKFLELPIEDPFLENNTNLQDSLEKLNSDSSITENIKSSSPANIGPMKYSRIPFNQADNPVLSVVTFLASIADPKATKAAVKAAVEELEQPNSLKKYIQSYKESILKKDSLAVKNNDKKDDKNKQEDSEKPNESRNKLKSTKEEIETQKMLNKLIELKLKKFELKYKNFELLEKNIENEKKEFERQHQNLYIDKLVFKRHIQQKNNNAKRTKLY